MADHDLSPLSRKDRVRSSLCCFHHHTAAKPRMFRSSSHLKDKCSGFMSRIGRHGRRHSADFHYDALSYAMNFEDDAAGNDERHVDDSKSSFPARLPPPSSRGISSDSSTSRELAALG